MSSPQSHIHEAKETLASKGIQSPTEIPYEPHKERHKVTKPAAGTTVQATITVPVTITFKGANSCSASSLTSEFNSLIKAIEDDYSTYSAVVPITEIQKLLHMYAEVPADE
jgi:hypothetical protein